MSKHLMTPIDALTVIHRLLYLHKDASMRHVSYVLGISFAQLSKEIRNLKRCIYGHPVACDDYNTRRVFMRQLFLMDNSNDITLKFLIEDALETCGSEARSNIASKRTHSKLYKNIVGANKIDLAIFRADFKYIDSNLVLKNHHSVNNKKSPLFEIAYIKNNIQHKTNNQYGYSSFCKTNGIDLGLPQSKFDYQNFCTQIISYIEE